MSYSIDKSVFLTYNVCIKSSLYANTAQEETCFSFAVLALLSNQYKKGWVSMRITLFQGMDLEMVTIIVITFGFMAFLVWTLKVGQSSNPEPQEDKVFRWIKYSVYFLASTQSSVFLLAVVIHYFLPAKLKNYWVAFAIAASLNWLA